MYCVCTFVEVYEIRKLYIHQWRYVLMVCAPSGSALHMYMYVHVHSSGIGLGLVSLVVYV